MYKVYCLLCFCDTKETVVKQFVVFVAEYIFYMELLRQNILPPVHFILEL